MRFSINEPDVRLAAVAEHFFAYQLAQIFDTPKAAFRDRYLSDPIGS